MATTIKTTCAIAGGGPAGLMLAFLLARAGIDVVVVEKHKDFLRDFRGDTIHPSTMEVMHELGLLDEFLKLPHQPTTELAAQFGDERIAIADFSHLPVTAKFIAMMPQWDFLNFLDAHAETYKGYHLHQSTEATSLIRENGPENGKVIGMKATGPEGDIEIHADLTIAADGRDSTLRADANMKSTDLGAPMDVLWFRISRKSTDTDETFGRFDAGHIFIMLNRGDYWQCAYVIPKGSNDKILEQGLEVFRKSLCVLFPSDNSRPEEITSWDQVKLLTVQVNRLEKWWQPGFLCIGDAAHAMSPLGGVGVNLAVQDAVATANILFQPLLDGTLQDSDLEALQTRREWPAKITQKFQVLAQNNIIATTLASKKTIKPPLALRILTSIPGFKRIPARLVGLGVRPEHISEELKKAGG